MDERIAEFSRERLGGRPVPDDLATLLVAQWSGRPGPLKDLEITFFGPGETHALLDHSYLKDEERTDPGIMANVIALDEVNRHIGYVAEGLDGGVIGYWFHPSEPTDSPAAIVLLDTEGQYEVLDGTTFAEAAVGKWVFDDEVWFELLAEQFVALGVSMSARCWDDLEVPELNVNPAELHRQLYEAELARRTAEPA